MMIELAAAFLGGASYALAGMMKNYLKGEELDLGKISKTMALAGAISLINHLSGVQIYDRLDEAFMIGAGETMLAEYLLKSIHGLLRRMLRGGRWLG